MCLTLMAIKRHGQKSIRNRFRDVVLKHVFIEAFMLLMIGGQVVSPWLENTFVGLEFGEKPQQSIMR